MDEYKIASYKEIDSARTGKYVESGTVKIFRKVKKALEGKEKCVFRGTPCYVIELRQYLGKD